MGNYLIFLQDIISPREGKLSFALSLTWCLTNSQCSVHTDQGGVGALMLRYLGNVKVILKCCPVATVLHMSSGLKLLLRSSIREPIVILF